MLLQHLEASLLYHLQPLQRELAECLNGHWAFRIFQGHLELGCDRRQRLEEEHLRDLQEHLRGMQGVITQRVALLASLQEQRVHLMLEATMVQRVREVQNLLTRNLGVEIGILPEDGQPVRLEVVGVPHAVENAQMELQQHRQEGFARTQRQLAEEAGARTVDSQTVVDHWTRGNHGLWWLWQECGFWVEGSSSMADCIFEHIRGLPGHHRNQILALCTGDGRHVDTVRDLVWRGWTIEIWCWRESCHSDYLALDESHRNLRICYLDGFRPWVTMAVREDDPVPEQPQQPPPGEDVDTCRFCLSEEATFAFRPCNHRVLCANCAENMMYTFQNPELRQSANLHLCFVCRTPWRRLTRDR